MLNKFHMVVVGLFLIMCKGNNPSKALTSLKEGNKIFLADPNNESIRAKLSPKQRPIAVIVGCSDSRATPSKIFNQLSLGRLFEIRNAGNIADCTTIGSIEYAVQHLNTPLIVVLGHQNCGAVEAALQSAGQSGIHSECIQEIIDVIDHGISGIGLQEDFNRAKLLEEAIKKNICQTVNTIKTRSAVINSKILQGQVQIVGAYYNFNGNVEWLNCSTN